MTIGQILTTILLGSVLLACFYVKFFPENPKKVKRIKKLYYSRDYQGRFSAASRKKKVTYIGGGHKYVTTNI